MRRSGSQFLSGDQGFGAGPGILRLVEEIEAGGNQAEAGREKLDIREGITREPGRKWWRTPSDIMGALAGSQRQDPGRQSL